jgi:hypothetical protein
MIKIAAFEQTVEDLIRIITSEFPSYSEHLVNNGDGLLLTDELVDRMSESGWVDEYDNLVIDGETFVTRWVE